LLRLFGRAADGAALSWELSVERELVEAGHAVRYVRVPERYGYFTGHFPGYPLLPGAAQLSELVVPFVRAVRPELGRLTRMARLKFQERIVPNDLVEVSLSFGSAAEAAAEQSVEFALRRGGSVCANGRLWFAPAADGGGVAAAREVGS
jgi:3-hydroxymyristoyl/3-hydroxydecanoyl-(acyl carrier protein) dehydratase